jgi:hypothetical protein
MRLFLLLCLASMWIACGDDTDGVTPATTADAAPLDTADGTTAPPEDASVTEVTPEDGTPSDLESPEDVKQSTEVAYGVPCPSAERIGGFIVGHEEFYAQVSGEVAAGVIPLTVLQEVETLGDCRLMRKENPFCETPCQAGELCDHDGTCVEYPANKSVGTVTVSGLKDGDVVMEPKSATYFDTNVSMPLFEPSAPIHLVASGDELPGFELDAFGVPDLELPSSVITMTSGSPLDIIWSEKPGNWKLYFSLNIDQHGSSPATLFCEVPDTGSYQVPAQFVDAILSMGVSGFATAHFYRRTVDSVTLEPGCVELTVSSYVYGKLDVDGHTACKVDPDCPEGEVCEISINTCVEAD